MKTERISWPTLSGALAISLIFTCNQYDKLKDAFLVRSSDIAYVNASILLFSKEQGLKKE